MSTPRLPWCKSCYNASDRSRLSRLDLLLVGSVQLSVKPQAPLCDHDGYHNFKTSLSSFSPLSVTEVLERTSSRLDHLIAKGYIEVTYRLIKVGEIIVKVYVDLEKIQGKTCNSSPQRRLRVGTKPPPSEDAKISFHEILPALTNNPEIWNDGRTLAEIFMGLSSPSPIAVQGYGEISTRLLNLEDTLEGLGIRSVLNIHQRRSVASMLQRELDKRPVPDPLFIRLTTVDETGYFLRPETMEFQKNLPVTDPCRGGILCEDSDAGKSLIIVTLIATTIDQISGPVDSTTVMTPLSFRHFPSEYFATSREKFSDGDSRVPSLVELMLHRSRTTPYCNIPNTYRSTKLLESKENVSRLPLGELLGENAPFYIPPASQGRPMYLTSATLVVVPANLLSQWKDNILKHCSTPLRVLLLTTEIKVPSVKILATYFDIILMSYTRFTEESNPENMSELNSCEWNCSCDESPYNRVPICSCQMNGLHPFLQIRWKRLVIDEDLHSSVPEILSTTLMSCASKLSVERRWIVTGTPTTNLSGLCLGTRLGFQVAYIQASRGNSAASKASTSRESDGKWTENDRKTLIKLGNLIIYFIRAPIGEYSSGATTLQAHVIKPLFGNRGPKPGSIRVLDQLMEMMIIRHR